MDIETCEGFREAVRLVAASGWDHPAGEALSRALFIKLRPAGAQRAATSRRSERAEDTDDMASRAWEIVNYEIDQLKARGTTPLLEASSPWGWLIKAAKLEAQRTDVILDRQIPGWLASEGSRATLPPSPVRIGASGYDLAAHAPAPMPVPVDPSSAVILDTEDFGPVLRMATNYLITRGVDQDLATLLVLRGTQVLTSSSKKASIKSISDDARLLSLGLSHAAAAAVLSLLRGSASRAGLLEASALAVKEGRLTPGALPRPMVAALLEALTTQSSEAPASAGASSNLNHRAWQPNNQGSESDQIPVAMPPIPIPTPIPRRVHVS